MQKDPRYLQKTGRGWQKEEMTDGQGNYYDQYGREYGWSVAQRETNDNPFLVDNIYLYCMRR